MNLRQYCSRDGEDISANRTIMESRIYKTRRLETKILLYQDTYLSAVGMLNGEGNSSFILKDKDKGLRANGGRYWLPAEDVPHQL